MAPDPVLAAVCRSRSATPLNGRPGLQRISGSGREEGSEKKFHVLNSR
jgi:hypothetical protein